MISISIASIGAAVGILSILGSVFAIFFYFQKPQIALEKRVSTLEDAQKTTNKEIEVIKTTHLDSNNSMQQEMKELTLAINSLNLTVAKLETKIDERIPKGSPGLTPPGK